MGGTQPWGEKSTGGQGISAHRGIAGEGSGHLFWKDRCPGESQVEKIGKGLSATKRAGGAIYGD